MTTKQQVRHRCDWMNDSQLVAFIESLSSLLFEALEEQRERREKENRTDDTAIQPTGTGGAGR